MAFQKTLIWINSVLFAVFGVGFVFAPESLARLITGAAPATPSAVTDMRATYGGMALGLGLMFGMAARGLRTVSLGIRAVFLVMASLAGARLLGIVVDGSPSSFMYLLLAAEAVMAILALWALRSGGKG